MMFRNDIRAILVPLTLTVADSVRAGDSAYTFSFNGAPAKVQHYSLNGNDSVMAPGDVIRLDGEQLNYGDMFMTLGEQRNCRFVTIPAIDPDVDNLDPAFEPPVWDGRIFLELPDGRRKVVAVIVSTSMRRRPAPAAGQDGKKRTSFERTLDNPLDDMSPEEIHGLWGITLNHWPEGIEQKLAHVNADRICITMSDYAGIGGKRSSFFGGPKLPPIPLGTRHLIVRGSMSPGLHDFSHLSQLRDLAFLRFHPRCKDPLDAGLICQNVGLRYLDISGCGIPNHQKLASLTELRFLNIARCRDIDTLDLVGGMHQLKTLHIAGTPVTSLASLDGSDSIREIYAGMTGVGDLPKGDLPSLRTINLLSTKVNAEAVARFREAHPACNVQYGWADSLRNALQGATRLRIRSGGTCHRQVDEEKTLVEITSPDEIEHLLDGIAIDEPQSGGGCMCCGDPTFEFYADDRLLAMVGYHHGQSLRWPDGPWWGDAQLTPSSQAFTISWLAQRGVDGPQHERDERQKWQDEDARQERRYTELIPGQTVRALMEAELSLSRDDDSGGDRHRKAVAEAFISCEKDVQASIKLYLSILGVAANGGWNMYNDYDTVIAKELLPRFKGPDLAQAAADVMEDDEGMMGAARWLLGEEGWRNLDESDRQRILSPLARWALQHRSTRIRKGVMNVLSEIDSTWAAEALQLLTSKEPETPEAGP